MPDQAPLAPASPAQQPFTVADFDYALPESQIAQHPLPTRSGARLLDGTSTWPVDRQVSDLPGLLRAGDLVVFNNTRVIKARMLGEKATGGAVEALVERVLPHHEVLAHVRASKSPKPGSTLSFARGAFEVTVLGRGGPDNGLFRLRFPSEPMALLEAFGHVPLPPYITHADGADDVQRYQTVFAQHPGAVAAPTASLHFDEALLQALSARGIERAEITLHVGAGTFQPVRTEVLAEHRMHSEWYEVSPDTAAAMAATRARGGRVVAVGTTVLRALESAALAATQLEAGEAGTAPAAVHAGLATGPRETRLFITPGFDFRVVDVLFTNFHLPRSTLLMLVSALAGHAHVRALYRHAVESGYRFFSYGDAMLLQRAQGRAPA